MLKIKRVTNFEKKLRLKGNQDLKKSVTNIKENDKVTLPIKMLKLK